MNIDEYYQSILKDLELGGRGLRRFNSNELSDLESLLSSTINTIELKKVLCLIEHSASFHHPFSSKLIDILNHSEDVEVLVYTLNAARKHILAYAQQQGKRLEFDYLQALQKSLYSKNPEVVEWALRSIEEMGSQGIFFKKDLAKIKPAPWKWFNEHQRSVREIIAMLEFRWSEK